MFARNRSINSGAIRRREYATITSLLSAWPVITTLCEPRRWA